MIVVRTADGRVCVRWWLLLLTNSLLCSSRLRSCEGWISSLPRLSATATLQQPVSAGSISPPEHVARVGIVMDKSLMKVSTKFRGISRDIVGTCLYDCMLTCVPASPLMWAQARDGVVIRWSRDTWHVTRDTRVLCRVTRVLVVSAFCQSGTRQRYATTDNLTSYCATDQLILMATAITHPLSGQRVGGGRSGRGGADWLRIQNWVAGGSGGIGNHYQCWFEIGDFLGTSQKPNGK